VSVNVGKKVLSSPSVLKSRGKQLMKFFIFCIERVNFPLEIVFNSVEFILILFEIAAFFFDGFKFNQMLLVLHFDI
jgi:hypothetical protein